MNKLPVIYNLCFMEVKSERSCFFFLLATNSLMIFKIQLGFLKGKKWVIGTDLSFVVFFNHIMNYYSLCNE